jgi:hypothetical protein
MFRSDRPSCTAVAVLVFASLAAVTSVDARGEEPRAVHHAPARTRHAVRHEAEARQSHHAYTAHAEAFHAPPGRIASQHSQSGSSGGAAIPVARYSSTTHTVERTIRPGLVSRTFVSRGQVIATRMYQSHVWHQFGRAFAYETFVPTVRYPAVYYSWALAAWPRPFSYAWGWRAQPWYPTYGVLFTPYPVYTSPDLWMTDYVIAQSLQTAYQVQPVAPTAQQPSPPPEPVINAVGAMPSSPPSEVAPAPESSAPPPPPPASEGTTAAPSGDTPAAPVALPPAITPAVKAQLDTQIKVQLQDRQAQATSATLTTQSTPPALRPNHVFFQVVQPLSVPTSSANGVCSLSPSDYIKRTGGMSPEDWTIPVVVELSSPSDCPAGLHTRIGLNDLNAMENEQEARVMDALQAASKSMGPNGPPSSTPEVHPTQIADSRAAPDLSGLSALPQAR